jgi:hypothetical protein
VKKDEMGITHSTHREANACTFLVGEISEETVWDIETCTGEYENENIREIRCEDVKLFELAQHMAQWCVLKNAIINHRIL